MFLKLANDFIWLLFLRPLMYLCMGKKVPWLKLDERTLCMYICLGFFSHSVEPPSQKFIYLFWHKDKSKAASASHNQIRASWERERENEIMQHHRVDCIFLLNVLWVVFGAVVNLHVCVCVCGISCFYCAVNTFECVSHSFQLDFDGQINIFINNGSILSMNSIMKR